MLFFDVVLFGALFYYFDAVLPKEFGVRRHPLFPLMALRNGAVLFVSALEGI